MIIQHEGTWYLECPAEEAQLAKVGQLWLTKAGPDCWEPWQGEFYLSDTTVKRMGATFFKLLPMPGEGEWDVFYGRDAGDRVKPDRGAFYREEETWCSINNPPIKEFMSSRRLYALPKPVQPEVPEGYRLATEEDRRGPKPHYVRAKYWHDGISKWCDVAADHSWTKDYYWAIPLPSQPPVGESIEFHLPDDLYQVERFLTAAKFFPWTGVVRVEASSDQTPEAMPSTGLSGCRNCGCPDCIKTQEELEAGSTEGSTKNEFNSTYPQIPTMQTKNVGINEQGQIVADPQERDLRRERGEPWPTEVEAEVQNISGLTRWWILAPDGLGPGDKVYIRRAP